MTNADVAAFFERLADLLEYRGENAFRIRAYRSAAGAIEALEEPLSGLRADPVRSLTDLPGIGRDIAEKIGTILDTGRLPALDAVAAEVPEVVSQLLRVPGLGPKKARQLVDGLGIASLDDLEAACRDGRVRKTKGFGEKTAAAILKNLAFVRGQTPGRLLWKEADGVVATLLEWMRGCGGIARIEGAGEWRRGCETVDRIVLLATADHATDAERRLRQWEHAEGGPGTPVRGPGGIPVELHFAPAEAFGAAWILLTGSPAHVAEVSGRALEAGWRLDARGLSSAVGGRRETTAAGDETEVYRVAGLPWIPPELREGRGEIAAAAAGPLPRLVEASDMRGDLHMHTTDTDGEDTLAEMVRAAAARGLEYVAITDHGKRVAMANGLDESRLRAQWERIDRLNESLRAAGPPAIVVLKGIEVDILERGGLDLPDAVLAEADWVVASLHYGQNQPRESITARILEAVEHPAVRVIGHPTGRLLLRRPAYDVDIDAVIAAAARTGTFLEINANPSRLDLDDRLAAAARKAGVGIVISTDAHSVRGLDLMGCGVLQARRAGLEAADVVNARPWAEFRRLLGRKGR